MTDIDCRGKLISATTPLFAEKGLHGVSVRELAKAAGVNLSMISYYFGGKEGLYSAVLSEQFAFLEKLEEVEQKETDTLKKLELYVRSTVSRYRNNPYLLRFYTSELTNPTVCFETIIKPAIKRILQILMDTFTDGLSHDKFRDDLNRADTVLALAGMINFYFLLEPVTTDLVNNSPERDEELIRHIMDIFTKGVLK